jgi:hypothetical protein
MLTSPVIPTDVIVDFDLVDFLPIWDFSQNVITFAYDVCLRKKLYGWNQHDETDAMEPVYSNSDNFEF